MRAMGGGGGSRPPGGGQGGAAAGMQQSMEMMRAAMGSGGSAPPAAAADGGMSQQMEAMRSMMAGRQGGSGGPSGPPTLGSSGSSVPEKAPESIEDLIKHHYKTGDEDAAIRFVYADAIVNDKRARDLADEMKWAPSLKRPSLAIRWGVGIELNAPKEFDQHPHPIGYEDPNKPAASSGNRRRGNRRNQFPGMGMMGAPGQGGSTVTEPTEASAQFAFYTGDFGDAVLQQLNDRATEGKFGAAIEVGSKYFEKKTESAAAPVSAGPSGPGGMNGAMMQAMQRQMGGGRGGPPAANTASSDKVESKLLAPGVTYLGKGSAKELMAKADKAGIDYVVVFKVDITVGPKDKVSNSTRVRILPASRPAKGSELKEIYAGKSMNSEAITKRMNEGDSPLEKEIEPMMAAVDSQIKLGDLPSKLTSEAAKGRVAKLAESKERNPLRSMVEIRYFHTIQMIDDKDLKEAIVKILGDESKYEKLMRGESEMDRCAVLRKWLPDLPST